MFKPEKMMRFTGLTAVTILWIGTLINIAVSDLPLLSNKPLSSMGVDTQTSGLFTLTLSSSALLFVLFAFWLYRVNKASWMFMIVFIFGHVCQSLVGFLSLEGSTKSIHALVAYMWAISLPISMLIFSGSGLLGAFKETTKTLARLETIMTVLGIGGFILIGRAQPLFQILVALVFHYWVIQTTRFVTAEEV